MFFTQSSSKICRNRVFRFWFQAKKWPYVKKISSPKLHYNRRALELHFNFSKLRYKRAPKELFSRTEPFNNNYLVSYWYSWPKFGPKMTKWRFQRKHAHIFLFFLTVFSKTRTKNNGIHVFFRVRTRNLPPKVSSSYSKKHVKPSFLVRVSLKPSRKKKKMRFPL